MRQITVDVRVGCVAVYEGPWRDCLAKCDPQEDFLFYRRGIKDAVTGEWRVLDIDIDTANQFADNLRAVAAVENDT